MSTESTTGTLCDYCAVHGYNPGKCGINARCPRPEGNEPFVLADLASLKVSGPALLIFRPRERVPLDSIIAMAKHVSDLSARAWWPKTLGAIVVQQNWDLLTVGDADLERMGLMRIPTTLSAEGAEP